MEFLCESLLDIPRREIIVGAIGIDYTPAYEQGAGIGRYVRELINALARIDTQTDYRLFIAGAMAKTVPKPIGTNFTYRPIRLSPKWLARFWQRAQIPYPVENIIGDVALFHATDFVLPPVRKGTKTLLTVHDLSYVRVPETATVSLKGYLDVVVPRSIARATHIVADSQATRADIIELYNTPPERITVLLSGVDAHFQPITMIPDSLLTQYGIPHVPYIFAVGTVQPRKNYSRLVRALAQLRLKYDVHLVIAGGRGWLDDEIYATITQTKMADYVHLIGFVDDADLPALYSRALCVAFPSLYEGFGFPILEGMACGVPVVTANNSSLPEVAGDAAILIDPYSIDEIHNALERVISDQDLRENLIHKGFLQVKKFTWENTATQLVEIYQRLLKGEML